MELIINGEKADFTLEKEKNAKDVVMAVTQYLEKQSLVMSTLKVNGAFYSAVLDEKLSEIPIADIGQVVIEAMTRRDLILSLLSECKKVLNTIAADLKTNGYANAAKYKELFDWITETLELINQDAVFNLVEAKLVVSTIRQIETYLANEYRDEKKTDSLVGIILNLVEFIEAIELKMSADFNISKKDLLSSIAEAQAILPEISADFQVGKDKDALNKVHNIISVLEFCCLYLKKNLASFSKAVQEEIDDLYNEMNSLLSEIVTAFENGDFVLIGDLLEYELPEKLESYKSLVLD